MNDQISATPPFFPANTTWMIEPKTVEEYSETSVCKRVVLTGISTLIAAGVIACKFSNFRNWNANAVASTSLSLLAGAGIQNMLQCGLKRDSGNKEKEVLGTSSFYVFWLLSQVYNNLNHPSTSLWRAPIFSTLTGLYGMNLAAYAHTLIAPRYSSAEERTPLNEEKFVNPKYLKMLGLNETASRIACNITKLAFGVGGIFLGTYYPLASIVRGYSSIWVGKAIGSILNEVGVAPLQKEADAVFNPVSTGSFSGSKPRTPKREYYNSFIKAFWIATQVFQGGMIAAGGGMQKAKWSAYLANACFLLAGLSGGIKRHVDLYRFTKVPIPEIKELPLRRSSTLCQRVCHTAKRGCLAIAFGAYIGLGLAGFSFQTWDFQPVKLVDQIALGFIAAGLYGGYTVAKVAKHYFDPQSYNTPIRNTAYFFTHYSPGIPWLALYINEVMEIGDIALEKDSSLSAAVAILANFLLYWEIGYEVASYGDYKRRFFSPITAALMSKFVIQEATNQI